MSEDTKVLLFIGLCPAWLMLVPVVVAALHIATRGRLRLLTRVGVRRWRRAAAFALMAGAVAGAVKAMTILGHWDRPPWEGLPYLGAAAACFVAALLLCRLRAPRSLPIDAAEPPLGRFVPLLALVGWALILLLSELVRTNQTDNRGELLLWLLGIGLFVVGATPPAEWRAAVRGLMASWRAHRREWLFLLGVTLLALALRLIWPETALPVLFGDEAPFSVDAMGIDNGTRASIFAPGHQGHPWLFPVMQAPLVHLLGRRLLAVRILPALFGTLTVPALYLMAREFFNRRVAAVAAAFLATYPVHVHFSRIGINNIVDPLFGVLAFALLWRGLRTGRRLPFALAGVSLGMGQYFYSGGRLLLVLMGGLLLYLLASKRRRLLKRWRGLLAMLGGAAITVWPAFALLYNTHTRFIYRAPLTSIFEDKSKTPLLQAAIESNELGEFLSLQLRNSYLGYIHTPDQFHFYAGQTAMLLPLAAVVFLLGLMWAAWRWYRPAEGLLIAWLGMTALLGGATMRKTPGYARYVIATPAIAVLVGLGLVMTADFARRAWPRLPRWRPVLYAAAAVFVAFVMAQGVQYYFNHHLDSLKKDGVKALSWEMYDLRTRIQELPPDAQVHIISDDLDMHSRTVIRFFDGDRTVIYHQEQPVSWDFVGWLEPGRQHVFFASQEQMNDLWALAQMVPGGEFRAPPYAIIKGKPYPAYEVLLEQAVGGGGDG